MSSESREIPYAEAVAELDAILAEIDRPDVDLDRLTGRVERASELVRLLKSKIAATEMQVTQVVEAMREEAAPPPQAEAPPSEAPPFDEPEFEAEGADDGAIPF